MYYVFFLFCRVYWYSLWFYTQTYFLSFFPVIIVNLWDATHQCFCHVDPRPSEQDSTSFFLFTFLKRPQTFRLINLSSSLSQTGSVGNVLFFVLSNVSPVSDFNSQNVSVTLRAPSAPCVTPTVVSVSVARMWSAGTVTDVLQPRSSLDPTAAEVRISITL